jgi:extracellular factor (EF) 3-hydroxypalmitic acid methyl ester biosynthesis protein
MATQNGPPASGANGDIKESLVVGQNSQGMEIRASPLRLTRHLAVFEIYNPALVLRASEVLSDFKIVLRDRAIYSGQAVVRSLVDTGLVIVCEATLNENSWRDVEFTSEMVGNGRLRDEFASFMHEWQKLYKITPEFKVVVADMQSFLSDLRLWLEQVELEIRSSPSGDRAQIEGDVVDKLAEPVIRSIDAFIEQFEAIAQKLEPELQPIHRSYLRRQWHPLVLSSPFAYRAYHKPLGFAGDYEMVNMMLRSPHEGSTLFAKILNVWLLGQAPVVAHRNRVTYLQRKLVEEASRLQRQGRPARVYNVGCGPAGEVQRFFREGVLNDQLQITLVDFNEETLRFLADRLKGISARPGQPAAVQLVRKSVQQILKEGARAATRGSEPYDFVYCAGLFDYLSDQICKQLMNIFYEMLAPGGLLLATNVSDVMNASRPFRYSMEYILDWHLIYRNRQAMASLAPGRAPADNVALIAEDTGVDLFIEVRKPQNA